MEQSDPQSSASREPVVRSAAFLRSFRGLWRGAGVAVAVLACIALSVAFEGARPVDGNDDPDAGAEVSSAEMPRDFQPGPAPVATRLGGVAYTDATAFFSRLGFKADYHAETKVLTLRARAVHELVLTVDKREARFDGMRIFLGEPVLLHEGAPHVATLDLDRFLAPILHPPREGARPLRTIVIDAGHGGNDAGTTNARQKLNEKTFTLDVAQRLQARLGDRWRVLQTRTEDRYVPLPDRAEFANREQADLFISIHFNAVAGNTSVQGTETYVLTPQFQRSTSSLKSAPEDKLEQIGNRHDPWSALLGYHMHRQLLTRLKTEDRGLKRARFAVLRLVNCPAVLVEAGYLSNDTEAKRIASAEYRDDIATALSDALFAYDAALERALR